MASCELDILKTERLIKVLKDRLNLFNMFDGYMEQGHRLLTFKNIGIRLENGEIVNWIKNNNHKIDEMFRYFSKNGSKWQRYRCSW